MMSRFNSILLLGLISIVLFSASACSNSSTGDDLSADVSAASIEESKSHILAGFAQEPILTKSDDLSGYWLAGFSIFRPSKGLHDPIYATATVLDDDNTKIAIVALDAFSWRYQDTLEVRNRIQASYGIDHVIVHAVHNHDVPDNNGMWSMLNPKSKDKFNNILKDSAVAAITKAAENMVPAKMYLGQVMDKDTLNLDNPLMASTDHIELLEKPNDLGLTDLRPPYILDSGIRFTVFKAVSDGKVIGSIVNWGNHVETMWRNNQLISADFPGYVRDGLANKLGGTTVYITGCVGAITTPEDEPEVFYNPQTGEYEVIKITTPVTYKGREYTLEDGFKKPWALGEQIADLIVSAVDSGQAELNPEPKISLYKESFDISIENSKFALVYNLGIMERDGYKDKDGTLWTTTEMNLLTIGNLWMLTVPGELYAEIAVGGVYVPNDNRSAGDYYDELPQDESNPGNKAAVEIPAIRTLMKGDVNMIMNLGNDHLGYLIPKSQWDEKKPYMLGYAKAPYGEENSIGPNAAGIIHKIALKLLEQVQ
jgi:hypothetical protein